MTPANNPPRSLLWLALLGGVVCLFGAHVGRHWDFTPEDLGVTFAWARNLAAGHGLVGAPGGERVEAPAELLWVLLVALAEPLRVSMEPFAKVLSLTFGGAALVAVAHFPSVAYQRRPVLFDLVAPAAAACFAHVALWTASGGGCGLTALLAALSLVALAREESAAERFPWSSLALPCLAATGPDAGLYLVAIAVAKATRAARRGLTRQDVLWWLFAAMGVGALVLFRLAYFAWPLPNAAYARAASTAWRDAAAWLGAYELRRVALVAPVALLSSRAPTARAALALCVVAGLAQRGVGRGGAQEEWRALAPVTPVACLLVAEGLRVAVRAALGAMREPVRAKAAPVLVVLAAWAMVRECTRAYGARFAAVRAQHAGGLAAGRARGAYAQAVTRALALPRAGVLASTAGGVAWGAGLAVMDLEGAADVSLAHGAGLGAARLREAVFGERAPALVMLWGTVRNARWLVSAPELEGMYLPLPRVVWGARLDEGVAWVRRELVAAPWVELVDALPASPVGPDRVTAAADAVSPGERVTLLLAARPVAAGTSARVVATPSGAGAAVVVPARVAGGLFDAARFEAGERPVARVTLALPEGRWRLAWRAGDAELPLGAVLVARDAGPGASRAAADQVRAHVAAGRMREARRVALRLRLRLEDAPGDGDAREGVAVYARALAALAARMADGAQWVLADDTARESRRFATDDPEANASVQRAAERMADASRRAEARGALGAAFELARDVVRVDPRRSWMRRRAERLRGARAPAWEGAREVAAYRAACEAVASGSPEAMDAALAALGALARWDEVAALVDRAGHAARTPEARVAVAHALLARGEVARAAEAAGCAAPSLAQAFAVLGARGGCAREGR